MTLKYLEHQMPVHLQPLQRPRQILPFIFLFLSKTTSWYYQPHDFFARAKKSLEVK